MSECVFCPDRKWRSPVGDHLKGDMCRLFWPGLFMVVARLQDAVMRVEAFWRCSQQTQKRSLKSAEKSRSERIEILPE